ncbi:ssk1 response regulator receiver [Podila humilis]|nr:ssk1 response regulator receiver [Podila humilis]
MDAVNPLVPAGDATSIPPAGSTIWDTPTSGGQEQEQSHLMDKDQALFHKLNPARDENDMNKDRGIGKDKDRDKDRDKDSPSPPNGTLRSSGRSHFKVQNRPAQLIRNLHANYFNRPPVDKSKEVSVTSAAGKTIQGFRGHIFASGAAISLSGCALLLGQGRMLSNQPWMQAQVVYHGLFAAACSWHWLRRMALSAAAAPIETLAANDLKHTDPITEPDMDGSPSACGDRPEPQTRLSSSLPYWMLGYGLLGALGSVSTLTHGFSSHWKPVSLLAACFPLIVGSVLLGLERISQALCTDLQQHALEKEAMQEDHEFLMEAYRDENLYKKNMLLETVGKEVQDAATLAIETLRQMTPTNLFPPTMSHEQLSACTLPIPITSVLGLFTTMLHLQYISRNMERLSRVMFTEYVQGIVEKTSPHYHKGENSFDVGEFVQSLGDLVSADASLKGVEFVIYHSEYDMNHVSLKGSEESWRHALINLIKSIIDCAKSGSTVELCLSLYAVSQVEEIKNKVMVSFEITYSPNVDNASEDDLARLNALLAYKLVKAMGGSLTIDQLDHFVKKFVISVEVGLHQASHEDKSKPQEPNSSSVHPLETIKSGENDVSKTDGNLTSQSQSGSQSFLSNKTPLVSPSPLPSSPPSRRTGYNPKVSAEPTIVELLRFTRRLTGLRVVVMAKETSVFAVHLNGYLKVWDINVSKRIITQGDAVTDGTDSNTTEDPHLLTGSKRSSSSSSLSGKHMLGKPETSSLLAKSSHSSAPAFIMIDDDPKVLGQQIMKLQAIPASPSPAAPRRPTHRRHKSASSIQHTSIIYFTSLPTFKDARDTVLHILGSQIPTATHHTIASVLAGPLSHGPLPYILVLPKPAGPRRILTAIHTAIHTPILDQTYSPIATAPTSPAPPIRHFSEEINPFEKDQIVFDPVSHQAFARVPQSTQSSPGGGSSPSNMTMADSRHGRDMVRQLIEAGKGAGPIANPFNQSPMEILSPETPGSIHTIGSPTGIIVPASGNQPSGIQFDPLARSSGSVSPSLMGPGQRRISNGSGRLLGHSFSGEGVVFIPPIAGAGGHHQSFTLAPNRHPEFGHSSANMFRLNSGHHHLRPGTASPLGTPPATLQSSLNLFSPPMTRTPAGMNSPMLQRPEQAAIRENSVGAGNKSSQAENPISPKPLHGSVSNVPPSPISPGTTLTLSSAASQGQQTTPVTAAGGGPPSSSTSGTRLRGPVSGKKAKDSKEKKVLTKSSVVERVSPLVNVLIVEDNSVNQAILVMFMKKRKIKCDVACNGLEAVEKWKTGGFHLVLMDIQMDVMDGIEATREIRRLEREQNIGVFPIHNPNTTSGSATSSLSASTVGGGPTSPPASPFRSPVVIVALTATAESDDVRNTALVAGCNDYVTKPIDLQWLENRIVDWGCMQALIDVDAWKKWKRDMEGVSPGSPGASLNPTPLKKTLPNSISRSSLKRPSISSRSIKGIKGPPSSSSSSGGGGASKASSNTSAAVGASGSTLSATTTVHNVGSGGGSSTGNGEKSEQKKESLEDAAVAAQPLSSSSASSGTTPSV